MSTNGLRRIRATTFLPDKVFDLNQALVVPVKYIPLDGLRALQSEQRSEINLPKYIEDEKFVETDEEKDDSKETIYNTLASINIDDPEYMYTHLLQLTQCYAAMATNQKIVAFTTDMQVRKAFYGLIYNSTRTGLIVDSQTHNITGVLSVTDFIMVLMKLWRFQTQSNGETNALPGNGSFEVASVCSSSSVSSDTSELQLTTNFDPEPMDDTPFNPVPHSTTDSICQLIAKQLHNDKPDKISDKKGKASPYSEGKLPPKLLADVIGCMPISKWKEHLKMEGTNYREFITADVQQSLFHAVEVLSSRRIHRLPVMHAETNDCMFILTHRRILHFLWNFCLSLPKPAYMHVPVKSLKLGCWENIRYVTPDTPLIDALEYMIQDKISGMPVVEEDNKRVVDVYTRFDAIAVAFNRNFERMDMSVADAITQRTKLFGDRGRDYVVTVAEHATMWQVLEVFIEKNVHRIFAVNDEHSLRAVISLSDMIYFMVLRPERKKSG